MSSRTALLAGFLVLLIARVAVAAEMIGAPLNGWAHVVAKQTGVRLRAAGDAPVLAVARRDDEFVLDEPFLFGDRWIRVRTSDGRVGWIARDHLKLGRVRPPEPEPAGGTRDLLPDDPDEIVPEREPELPILRDPLPQWSTHVSMEYGVAFAQQKVVRDGPNDFAEGMKRGAGMRASVIVWDPLVLEGSWFGCRNLRSREEAAAVPQEESFVEPSVRTMDRIELSAGWRDTFGVNDQLALTLLGGMKRERLEIERTPSTDPLAPPAPPKITDHDATLTGFRLEYGFAGNRFLIDGEARHSIGRHTKGWSWGGGLRGRHGSGFELGISYRGSWYWVEGEEDVTWANRHVLSVALGKAF